MFRRIIALLLCMLTPAAALAEEAEGLHYRLDFQINAEAYPEELQDVMAGLADLAEALTVEGKFFRNQEHFELQAELMLHDMEATRTELTLYGTEDQWAVSSPALGKETLLFNLTGLMEFAIKGYTHLQVPLQRVALLFPFAHRLGLCVLVDTARSTLMAETGSRTLSRKVVMDLAEQMADTAANYVPFEYWAAMIGRETGYDDYIMSLLAQLPEWVEGFLPSSGLTVEVSENGETWLAGGEVLLRRDTDQSGAQALSVRLPAMPDGTLIDLDAAYQPGDDFAYGSLNLLLKDGFGETILRLHTDGSLPTSLPPQRPFSLVWEAEGPLVGGEGVHLYFEGAVSDQLVMIRQMTPDRTQTMLTVTAELENVQEDWTPQAPDGVDLFGIESEGLNALMHRLLRPMAKGLLPLIAEMPYTACQAVMNLMESSGIFGVLTSGITEELILESDPGPENEPGEANYTFSY